MKRFNLSLKEPHIDVIDDLKEKLSITDNNEIINKLVKSAYELKNNDLIFGTQREKCSGGCFAAEPYFEVQIEEDIFHQLKKIYKDYDFDDYKTDEEEVGKVIRCIINFFEDEPQLIK